MPRRARTERLETRTARLKLPVRREPHWFTIREGCALGYRRLAGGKSGSWIARRYRAGEGRTYQALGTADDHADADGLDVFTYAQALAAAQAWFDRPAALARRAAQATVGDALDAYLDDYRARGGRALATTRTAIEAHIRPALGWLTLDSLTPATLRDWHHGLAAAPPRRRGGDGRPAEDHDAQRARRATANRLLTILRAALNLAWRQGIAASDDAWRRVKPFGAADAPRIRFLNDDEILRLLNACPAGFRELVAAAALTGCRYGELTALRVGDVDLETGALHIRTSKSGKPRSATLTAEAVALFAPLIAGRPGEALVLIRPDGGAWGKSHQQRPLRDACKAARIAPAISFHILRHTHASRLLRAAVPMSVVAAQLGNEERICARHYAHLAPGHVAQAVRDGFAPLGITSQPTAIRTMAARQASLGTTRRQFR